MFLIAIGVSFLWLGLQVLMWLHSGEWVSATPATLGVDPLNSAWVGLDQSWRWVCDQSVHVHLWVGGWLAGAMFH